MMLFVGWVVLEARTENPLVDVRALRHPAVASANLAMFAGGIAMYLLLSLVTRYVQTPAATGYGFGLSTFQAGLVLVPFSLFGFVAGRLIPRLHDDSAAERCSPEVPVSFSSPSWRSRSPATDSSTPW
ncbi:hypothetical protein GS461_03830 [Rhodococcus hoagii]|nr:hypothetical protein [Prescottella equi]